MVLGLSFLRLLWCLFGCLLCHSEVEGAIQFGWVNVFLMAAEEKLTCRKLARETMMKERSFPVVLLSSSTNVDQRKIYITKSDMKVEMRTAGCHGITLIPS